RAERAQVGGVEARADLARVVQDVALVVADEQRPEVLAAAARRRVAAAHEILLGRALSLPPVACPLARVRAVGALGDEPLPTGAARLAQQPLALVGTAVGRP